jgi:hypothetical protein
LGHFGVEITLFLCFRLGDDNAEGDNLIALVVSGAQSSPFEAKFLATL